VVGCTAQQAAALAGGMAPLQLRRRRTKRAPPVQGNAALNWELGKLMRSVCLDSIDESEHALTLPASMEAGFRLMKAAVVESDRCIPSVQACRNYL
jgi:hypothetical protein